VSAVDVGVAAALACLLAMTAAASPLPLWRRSRIYGRKSIFDMTPDEFRASRAERERDTIRFCLLLLGVPAVAALAALAVRSCA